MTVTILTGHVLDRLRAMADESVDCIVTDPPYGETSLAWDRWPDGWPAEARRVLRRTGSLWCFGSVRMFMERQAEFVGWRFAQDVVWEKHNGSNAFADRFRRVHECARQFYRDDSAWADVYKQPLYTADATARTVRRKNRPPQWGHIEASSYSSEDGGPRLMRSVMFCRSEHGRAEHPTQKPIAVFEPLVLYSCPPHGVLLDCFAGSGTAGIVAQHHGINAILIELNPEYAAMARRRIDADAPLLRTVK